LEEKEENIKLFMKNIVEIKRKYKIIIRRILLKLKENMKVWKEVESV